MPFIIFLCISRSLNYFSSQDSLLETLRRTNCRFVHCFLPDVNAGVPDSVPRSPAALKPTNPVLDVPLLRKQFRSSRVLHGIRMHRQGLLRYISIFIILVLVQVFSTEGVLYCLTFFLFSLSFFSPLLLILIFLFFFLSYFSFFLLFFSYLSHFSYLSLIGRIFPIPLYCFHLPLIVLIFIFLFFYLFFLSTKNISK